MKARFYILSLSLLSFIACTDNKSGTAAEQSPYVHASTEANPHFDLPDIQQNGELIILTLYGPESYFDFRGEDFGVQFMIAREYAKSIGARVRVEVARGQRELYQKLMNGEGDMVAYQVNMSDSISSKVDFIAPQEMEHFMDSVSRQRGDKALRSRQHAAWMVRKDSPMLAQSLNQWVKDHQADFFEYTTIRVRTEGGQTYTPRRHVSSPILNAARGQISQYDAILKQYAITCGWDWRLLAAQAYQESGFDPNAVSYMGAMGLMQLMPGTARQVGVSQAEVFNPTANVRGATKLISQLNSHYASVTNTDERISFILAAYNAGPGHVDDARALAKKNGKNPNQWLGNVDSYVLHMSDPAFYNQPEVHHGYFRGSETYDYVNSIRARWSEYKKKIK